jgi:hypothetical protein
MVRAAAAVLVVLGLAACNKPASQKTEAAASSAAPAAPPAPAHRWAYKNGVDYGYVSANHAEGEDPAAATPTIIRYLGQQDGVYTVVELENGAVVAASCAKPCQEVRLRGQGLDQTLALSPTSVIAAALADAMAGQLEIYRPQAAAAPAKP